MIYISWSLLYTVVVLMVWAVVWLLVAKLVTLFSQRGSWREEDTHLWKKAVNGVAILILCVIAFVAGDAPAKHGGYARQGEGAERLYPKASSHQHHNGRKVNDNLC